MSEDILIELCSDSGCGLIVANHGTDQHRVSLLPDEVLNARKLCTAGSYDQLKDYLVDIDPSFIKGINAVGIENIARDFSGKKLPPILKNQIKDVEMSTKNDSDLSYCPGGKRTFELFRKLYDERNMDLALATCEVPSPALDKFTAKYPEGPVEHYPDPNERIAWWDEFLKERMLVRDDRVPSAYLSEFDQGLYGALIGAEPEFISDPELGRVSSMVRPIFGSVAEWNPPPLSKDNPWFKIYEKQLEIFARGSKGKFGISHFILIDSLNYVCEAFGATNGFYAIIDDLEFVKTLYKFSLEVNCMVMDAFFKHIPLIEGGTCSNIGEWVPGGRIVSESIDCYHMMSADDFNKSGREPCEDIFARYDGGVLHIHSNGHHLVEHAATLKGLKSIKLKDDRGAPPAFTILDSMRKKAGTLPLIVHAKFAQFAEAVEKGTLPGGVHYMIKRAPDVDSVNRVMDKLRKQQEKAI